jgi:pyroglutamyl-peptidase I
MKILVTGFEPFGGDPENASQQAVAHVARIYAERKKQAADNQASAGASGSIPDFQLVTATLPVTFKGSGRVLRGIVEDLAPDVVLSIGEAGGRRAITPERRAQNLDNARIPDNSGDQPLNQPIDPSGQDLGTELDVDAMVAAIRAVGLPAEPSDDAGLFVCNHVFYEGARLAAELPLRAGFIHVPAIRSTGTATVGAETDAAASAAPAPAAEDTPREMTFEDLGRGIYAAVESIAAQHRAASQETNPA